METDWNINETDWLISQSMKHRDNGDSWRQFKFNDITMGVVSLFFRASRSTIINGEDPQQADLQ